MIEAPAGALINLGEWKAPLNGAVWVHGGRWKLESKFRSDFTPGTLARFEKLDEAAARPVNGSTAPGKAMMLAGGETIGALQTGGKHTDAALDTAATHTGKAISKSATSVGRSLKKATQAVGGAVGAKK
jgi:hypothetical protein